LEREEVYTEFWWENLGERDHLENQSLNGKIILKLFFRKWDMRVWTGWIWLRIGTGGGQL